MPEILIVGGGFAGVWSAASAVRLRREADVAAEELTVTLVAPGDDLVIRPRLYEPRPGEMRVPLRRILEPIGVEHVRAAVQEIDTDARQVVIADAAGERRTADYERLVLASGSQLRRPELPGAELLHDVDTLEAAVALERHLRALPDATAAEGRYTAVVVGSGFTGLEVATELVGRLHAVAEPHGAAGEVRVVLLELGDTVGPDLGPGPRPVIESAIAELGIELRLGTTLAAVGASAVELSDGSSLPALTAVWTAGLRASPLTELVPAPRDDLGRLAVDRTLRAAGVPSVLAAGDTAAVRVEDHHHAMQSCQHASPMGKHAGRNAAADLLGVELVPFDPKPYVTCLDLGAAGAVFTAGWDREVQSTGVPAKQLKRKINRAIYPPADDAAKLLELARPGAGSARDADPEEAAAADALSA